MPAEACVPKGLVLASGLALATALLMAAPVVVAPHERLFGSGAVLGREDPNRDPLVVIEQLRSGRVPAPYLQPLTDLPGRALARIVGPVAAYNVLVLVTFPLSAAAAYLLARHAVGSHLAAMVAALVYAFLPYHVTQAAGHPHVAQTQWLPLYFLALWRCVERPDVGRAVVLTMSAAATALADFYGGFMAAVMSPVALVAFGALSSPAGRIRRAAITGLVLMLSAGAGIALIHLVAPAVLSRSADLAFPRADLFTWSARWWSYLAPPVENPLLGGAAQAFWARRGVADGALEHQQVSLGWSILALAAVVLWCGRRGDRSPGVRAAPALASLGLFAIFCSLSPERAIGSLTFVRPSALLYELAPMFRAYARFGVVAGLMAALLAGAGAARLWHGPASRGRRAAVLLLGLAALEYASFPPWRWRDVLPTRAHRWLAAQPGPLRVLDCVPPSRVSDTMALSHLGHAGALLGSPVDDCGEPRLGEKLKGLGYTHIVVRADSAIGRWRSGEPPSEGLSPGPAFEDSRIFEVKAEPPDVPVGSWLGFHPREYEGEATWRWMGQTGALQIIVVRPPGDAVLELEMRAFPGERPVAWLLDGARLGEVTVGPGWRRYDLPLSTLAPGPHTLTLACTGPSVVANDVLRNGDSRPLGLAVGRLRIRRSVQNGTDAGSKAP